MIRTRIHTWLLLFALIDYGTYALVVGLHRSFSFYVIGGIYAWLAAVGAATGKWWSKPLVWSLGSMLLFEWLVYALINFRTGEFHPGSVTDFGLAVLPGLVLASVIGYCCYVVNFYVVPRPPSKRSR